MLGHEMFSSMAATPLASDSRRDTWTYSSIVVPQTLTMTVLASRRELGHFLVDESAARRCPAGRSLEHAVRCLDDPRRRVPSRASRNRPLETNGAKRRQIDDVRGVLHA
jgi:hypothetical protein